MLSAIDSGPGISQRRLASQMGIALGLTNSYIKRCVRKGFIKINEAPANRYFYYLTPKGFSEKTRLTARFLASSLDFYRNAAESCEQVYRECSRRGHDAVVLCGRSELAEIAFLKSLDSDVRVLGLVDLDERQGAFFSRDVWHSLDAAPRMPRVVTSLVDAEQVVSRIRRHDPDVPVYVPPVLGLSRDVLPGPDIGEAKPS